MENKVLTGQNPAKSGQNQKPEIHKIVKFWSFPTESL